MSQDYYGMKVTTILNAISKITDDLDYLCALIEQPDPGFPIRDAIVYTSAVTALSNQLEFLLEDIAENDLSQDEIHVKLSEEEVRMLQEYTETSDESLILLEEICGISLQSN